MAEHLRAKILVVSDAAAAGQREDRSGAAVRELLERQGWRIVACEIVPDDAERIVRLLQAWANLDDVDAVFTTGGTGLGPRDVTPEATQRVIEKEVPGLAELMRAEGARRVRTAVLSRGLVGVRNGKLIVNLPGSPRGARESLESILEVLPHAVDLLHGHTEHPSM